jgi:hypothetical protein
MEKLNTIKAVRQALVKLRDKNIEMVNFIKPEPGWGVYEKMVEDLDAIINKLGE